MEVTTDPNLGTFVPPEIIHRISILDDENFAAFAVYDEIANYDQQYVLQLFNCKDEDEAFLLTTREWSHMKTGDHEWYRIQVP
jgi:hypothetical protein